MIRLKSESYVNKKRIADWIENSKHRKVYLFTYSDLFFTGYEKRSDSVIPFFSPSKDFSYYVFTRQKAIEIREKFKKEDIDLNILL